MTTPTRSQLRGTYHQVLKVIAMHIAGPDVRPTDKQRQAIKEFFRAKYHTGRSTEDLLDQEWSDLINKTEAYAAIRWGVTFPARRERELETT
jgi:hypothetical protein